jgi:hypothetical protein
MAIRNVLVISLFLVFLAGCNQYEIDGAVAYSLDEALVIARNRYSGDIDNYSHSYQSDLEHLWEQAGGHDKEIIEKEMLALSLKLFDIYKQHGWDDTLHNLISCLDHLRLKATSEEVKTKADVKYSELSDLVEAIRERERKEQEEKREEWERKERERVEGVRAEFEKSRERLTKICKGTFKDKSTQEVKKLVDEWRQESLLRKLEFGGERWRNDFYEKITPMEHKVLSDYFSIETFYKIFGKPVRQQFMSSNGLSTGDSYIFYYNCKDGLVQIQISARALDDNGIVLIEGLNVL